MFLPAVHLNIVFDSSCYTGFLPNSSTENISSRYSMLHEFWRISSWNWFNWEQNTTSSQNHNLNILKEPWHQYNLQAASTEYRLFFAGVIAVVIFVGVSALAIMARVLYRGKGTCRSQDAKTGRSEGSPELAFSSSQMGPSENQKEYFI